MRKFTILALFVLLGLGLKSENILTQRGKIKNYSSELESLISGDSSRYFSSINSWKQEGGEFSSSFKVPFLWVGRSVFLRLDVVSGAYAVFVNDKKVGDLTREFTAKEFDVTSFVKEGRNSVKIKVFKDLDAVSVAAFDKQDLKIGSDNFVISQPPLRIADINYLTEVNDNEGKLTIGVDIKSELLNTKDIELEYRLYSPSGEVVAFGRDSVSLGLKAQQTVKFFAKIPSVRAWSHLEPSLYRLVVNTKYENRYMEHINLDLGFRTLAFEGENLLINGVKVDIVSSEINPGNDSLSLVNQMDKLKQEGVNLLIVKDKPASTLFYTLADRKGFYIADRVAILSAKASNIPDLESRFTRRTMDAYLNSKNHTSVVAYILAKDSKNGYNLYQSYLALKELKPQQAVIYPDAAGQWNSDKLKLNSGQVSEQDSSVSLEIIDPDLGKVRVCNGNKYNGVYNLRLSAKGSESFDLKAGECKEFTVEKTKKLRIIQETPVLYYEPIQQESPKKKSLFKKK